MKRLVICMDGTWQNLAWEAKEIDPVTEKPVDRRTNIGKIAQYTRPLASNGPNGETIQQIVFYSPGVGARRFVDRKESEMKYEGATGEGSEENIIAAYMFLSFNYDPGDEIYLFGFSRGAFCARSLGGLIARCGILKRDETQRVRNALELYRDKIDEDSDEKAKKFRAAYSQGPVVNPDEGITFDTPGAIGIQYIGVFETVVMRKMPHELLWLWLTGESDSKSFHNLRLGAHVKSARHAMALDEKRNTLPPTPWSNMVKRCEAVGADPLSSDAPYQQKWFVGAHGDVGGGEDRLLSEVSRKWVLRGACKMGLSITEDLKLESPATAPAFLDGKIEKLKSLLFLGLTDRTMYPEQPEPGEKIAKQADPTLQTIDQHLHVSAIWRRQDGKLNPLYRSKCVETPFAALIDKDDQPFKDWMKRRSDEMWS